MLKLHTVTLVKQDKTHHPLAKRRPAAALLVSLTLHSLLLLTLFLLPRPSPPQYQAPAAPQFTLQFSTEQKQNLLTDTSPILEEQAQTPAPSIQAQSAPALIPPVISRLTQVLPAISIDVTHTPSAKVATPIELTNSSIDLPSPQKKLPRKKTSPTINFGKIVSALASKRRSPIYPKLARQRGYQGTSVFIATINSDGSIRELKLSRTSGYAMLDRAAKEALLHWHFKPAKRNGITIASQLRIPIVFRLG